MCLRCDGVASAPRARMTCEDVSAPQKPARRKFLKGSAAAVVGVASVLRQLQRNRPRPITIFRVCVTRAAFC